MTEHTQKDFSNLYTPIAIVLAGVIIGAFAMVGISKMGGASGGEQASKVDIADVNIENDPYIGEKDAPVVLAYWSDFQCPYCKAVEMGHPQIPTDPALPVLIREYVDTGKLKIVFKDYAFLSEDSTTAAIWGRAVWDLYPTKYFAWREAMYNAQDEEHGGFGDEASIFELTKTITGIDANAVKTRVGTNAEAYLALIEADKAEGTSFGVQGTPGFITGKTLIPGALSPEEFKAAIEAQL
ncbi:MAG: protein-disulfide isomerase [Parcubacteria group bacterium Athens0416_74]|nr:MAG: protein-disulfide isomerase [Parcubacteria group bacterium Athens0416_74]